MSGKEEYKDMFLAEASENYEELNMLFTTLEKNPRDIDTIEAIFRITHTLKGNAKGMGYEDIASLAHTLEDFFIEIKKGSFELNKTIFNDLFKANDLLGGLIEKLRDPDKKVHYKGLKRKLEVTLNNLVGKEQDTEDKLVEEDTTEVAESQELKASKEEETEAKSVQEEVISQEQKVEKLIDDMVEPKETTPKEQTKTKDTAGLSFSDTISVPVKKLDFLMNLVGELIIERDRMGSVFTEINNKFAAEFGRLQRITSDLQFAVMDVRLVQVGFLFKKFYRIARDAAQIENKTVDLVLEGTETEIDRNILQAISDSLVHLVRNSISHGIETDEERKKHGKESPAPLRLRATSEKDSVIIEVIDDGKGIDPKAIKAKAIEKDLITRAEADQLSDEEARYLIFESGFSSAQAVTAISGRGVGMDVVKKAMDNIGGIIEIESEVGKGTTMRLILPSSMAVKDALLFQVDEVDYALALSYTHSVVSFEKSDIHKVGSGLAANYQGKTTSILFLKDLFNQNTLKRQGVKNPFHDSFNRTTDSQKIHTVVVHYQGKQLGIVVDRLQQQKEIVEKPLDKPIDNADFLSGVTILGNGKVCLVLDVASIIREVYRKKVLTKKIAELID